MSETKTTPAGVSDEAASYAAVLDGVREAADWFNGYLGWLDHTGQERPEGASELYARLDKLVEQNGGW